MRSVWTDHQFFFNLIALIVALVISYLRAPVPLAAAIAAVNLVFILGRRIVYLRRVRDAERRHMEQSDI